MKLEPRVLRARNGAPAVIASITAVARAVVLGAALVSSGACYTYSNVMTANNVAEERAEFRLSDEGRVRMQRQLGPGALTVEGRVTSNTDSAWTLKVYRLTNVEGFANVWSGEEIELPRSAVTTVSTRRLDRQASLVAAAGVTGVVAVFILSRSLFGGGSLFGDDGGGSVGTQFRR
jgi:hypothetical protein